MITEYVTICSLQGRHHPIEDALRLDIPNKIAILADGVTLFPLNEIRLEWGDYPQPSPVFIMCESWVDYLHQLLLRTNTLDLTALTKIASLSNVFLKKYNNNIGWQTFSPRPMALVGGALIIREDVLLGFTLGDIGLLVMRGSEIQYASPNSTPAYEHKIPKKITNTSQRRKWAFNHELNRSARYVSFNGDPRACKFISTFSIPVNAGDRILIFSDGLSKPARDLNLLSELARLPVPQVCNVLFEAAQEETDDKSLIVWQYTPNA